MKTFLKMKLLDTDIGAFKNELERFARVFARQMGLLPSDAKVEECSLGLFGAQNVDETDRPIARSDGRHWSVAFDRYLDGSPVKSLSNVMEVRAYRIGTDLLVEVTPPLIPEWYPFVVGLVKLCKQQWNADIIGWPDSPYAGDFVTQVKAAVQDTGAAPVKEQDETGANDGQPVSSSVYERNMTVLEAAGLARKALGGDAQAEQELRAYYQATGIDYDTALERWRQKLDPSNLERIERELADPARQMMYARFSQPEIINDPVLGAILDLPEAELMELGFLDAVRARLTAPIEIPPLPTNAAKALPLGASEIRDIKNKVTEILAEMQQQRIEQGEVQKILDAIRRVLEYVLKAGLPADVETKERLDKIYQAVNSDLSLQQKLELSLPIIPYILEYKVEVGAGVDVGAAMEELKARLGKSQDDRKVGRKE